MNTSCMLCSHKPGPANPHCCCHHCSDGPSMASPCWQPLPGLHKCTGTHTTPMSTPGQPKKQTDQPHSPSEDNNWKKHRKMLLILHETLHSKKAWTSPALSHDRLAMPHNFIIQKKRVAASPRKGTLHTTCTSQQYLHWPGCTGTAGMKAGDGSSRGHRSPPSKDTESCQPPTWLIFFTRLHVKYSLYYNAYILVTANNNCCHEYRRAICIQHGTIQAGIY